MKVVNVRSIVSSNTYQYVDDGEPKSGTTKDVYFSPDRKYVVAIFREKQDEGQKERLKKITTDYLKRIEEREGGAYYLNEIYRWPTDVVEANGKTGIIVPIYESKFFFKTGYKSTDLLQGKEKNGKWFTTARNRHDNYRLRIDESELGHWLKYFQICVNLCRGVKKMHQLGLAHSDLSYNNVLADPLTGSACMIDLDGLVVPNLFNAEVIGTPDFIAPEVLASRHLDKIDPNRKLPSRYTDLHALAVLIYLYLLYRHPLKGGNYFGDIDADAEVHLLMGEKAIFIEHPTDTSNKNFKREYGDDLKKYSPFLDIYKTPYTITGPYLKALFDRAFVDGLHHPMSRPTAGEWEEALLKTTDLIQPCSNRYCDQKWYVFDNTNAPRCPFCGTRHTGSLPILDLYYQFQPTNWRAENHRLMVYQDQYLFQWHINREVIRNENLTEAQKVPVGYFSFHDDTWVLVNQKMTGLKDLTENTEVPIGGKVELTNGKKLLLSNEEGGRVALITLANQEQ